MPGMDGNLYRWAEQAAETLELPAWTGDRESVGAILDLSADAAHRVVRPAAPVTSFLAGVAVGLAGAQGRDELERVMALLRSQLPVPPDDA
jgi:hypothetical protein